MLLVRALNEFDIVSDPLKNGIASKQMIYDLTRRYYENNKKSGFNNLSEEEKDIFVKEHMSDYLKSHDHKLEKQFIKNSSKSREVVSDFIDFTKSIKGMDIEKLHSLLHGDNNLDFGSILRFRKQISTLQTHILYGSSKITDWISTCTNIDAVDRYYQEQDEHRLAVIKTNSNGLMDSDNILTVDVSSKDKIVNNDYLCNKIDINENIIDILASITNLNPMMALHFSNSMVKPTKENARSFNYSTASKEMCILRYIPKEHVLAVLEALQVDLLKRDMLSNDFFKLSPEEQKVELEKLKRTLQFRIQIQEDNFLKYIFEELYINNKNEKVINEDEKKVAEARLKILAITKGINNANLK